MSYIMIQDLDWDTMPGGTLVSTCQLFDEHDTAENPEDPENPLHGPATVEYRLVGGNVTATLHPPVPSSL